MTKEIVISFKTIYLNTYNIFVMDVTRDDEKTIIFRHESFQLWESEIMGVLLSSTKDFVTINRDGINVVALAEIDKRPVEDAFG